MFEHFERHSTSWLPLGGYSAIYLVAEASLVASSHGAGDSAKPLGTILVSLQGFRVAVLTLLVAATVSSRLGPVPGFGSVPCAAGDAERAPLLGGSQQRGYPAIEEGPASSDQDSRSDVQDQDKTIATIKVLPCPFDHSSWLTVSVLRSVLLASQQATSAVSVCQHLDLPAC